MRLTRLLLLAVSIIGISSIKDGIGHAQTEQVVEFGPKQYDKPKGRPITYTDTFQSISVIRTHTIWVQNGKDGCNEVKHLSIALNGVEVITSKDLRAHNPAAKPITVQPTNTLTVTLHGKEGNFVTVKILCEGCTVAPEVHLIFPGDGSTINKSSALVKGTISTDSHEVGITVNGVLAEISGGEFAVNGVPLNIGKNTITAVATDADGTTATSGITVHTDEYQNLVNLTTDKTSGLSPVTVKFAIDTQISNQITRYEMDFEGDGIQDQTVEDLANVSFIYTQVGLSYPTITVTDDQGNQYTDTTAVNVLSLPEMDTLLKAKWEGMKEGLQSGDIARTLKYFAEGSQGRYQGIFTALQGNLAEIAANMQEIGPIYIKDGIAKYRIRRQEDAGEITYYIYFQVDKDGLWKIRQF